MPTTLTPGDIAIIGYNRSSAPNQFTFINLVPLDPGTEIYFTTKGWTGTSLRPGNNEELIKFQVGSSKIPRGVVFNTTSTSSLLFTWTKSGAVTGTVVPPGTYSDLTLGNPDQIIAFQATNSSNPFSTTPSPPSIIYQLDYTGAFEGPPTTTLGDDKSFKVSSLDPNKAFVLLPSNARGGFASLSSFSGTKDQWLAEINNPLKWNNPSSLPLYAPGDYKPILIPVNLVVSSNTATEAGTTNVTVTATTDDGNASTDDSVVGDQTVTVTVSGTNITTGDYKLNGAVTNTATIKILDGQTTGTATFKVVDDAIVEGSGSGLETATLTIGSPSSRLVLGTTTSQTIDITDNDTASIVVTPTSGLTTTEGGGIAEFTVVLTSEPTANVTVNLTSTDTTEGTVSATPLTFTAADWSVAQTVKVTGVDDLIKDGDIAYQVTGSSSSSDTNYGGKNFAVSLTNEDNESASITVTPTAGLTTTEGGDTADFTVVLTSQPVADVMVSLTSTDTTEGAVSATLLTFTSTNWKDAQTVAVTGVDDSVKDGNIAYKVTGSASGDPSYAGKSFEVNLTNTDNETAGVTVTPLGGLTTTEAGGAATFTVVLTSQPTANVTVNLASSNSAEGTVSGPIVFNASDWNTPKTVTVTGVDDAIVDGNVAYSITGTLASSDGNYGGKTFTVSATNTDNDVAGGGSPGGGAPVVPPPGNTPPPSSGPGVVIDASRGIVINGGSGLGVNFPGISTVPTVPRAPVCPEPTLPVLPVLPLPQFRPNVIPTPPTITIGRSGSDFAIGSPRGEEFRGNGGSDRFFGMGGNDNLYGDADNDSLNGNAGDDVLQGGPGRDWVAGGSGNDAVWGGRDDDFLLGDLGADIVVGDLGNDTLFGDVNAGEVPRNSVGNPSDADRLFGGEGNDLLIGQNGDDSLSGGAGNDSLFGGVGKDLVWGDAGDDWLDGGEGDDTLIGGSGRDVFIVGDRPGMVTILDFEKGVDRLAGLDFGQVRIESLGCDTRILLGNQTIAYLVAVPSDGIGGSFFFNN